MSEQTSTPAASSTFERIKRTSPEGNESWSASELTRVLEYADFRNFQTVIEKSKEACSDSGHQASDHFGETTEMVILALARNPSRPGHLCKLHNYEKRR